MGLPTMRVTDDSDDALQNNAQRNRDDGLRRFGARFPRETQEAINGTE